MNIKKFSLGAVLVTLLMTLLSLVSPTTTVKAETKKYVLQRILHSPHLNIKIQMENMSELILN